MALNCIRLHCFLLFIRVNVERRLFPHSPESHQKAVCVIFSVRINQFRPLQTQRELQYSSLLPACTAASASQRTRIAAGLQMVHANTFNWMTGDGKYWRKKRG